MEYRELKQRIINHYGENHQMAKTVEELTELIHVIARRLQSGEWDKVSLYEELAYVYAMLDQLKLIFTKEEAVSLYDFNRILHDEMLVKLKRTEQRMSKDTQTRQYAEWKEQQYCDITREKCSFCTLGPCGQRYEKEREHE